MLLRRRQACDGVQHGLKHFFRGVRRELLDRPMVELYYSELSSRPDPIYERAGLTRKYPVIVPFGAVDCDSRSSER